MKCEVVREGQACSNIAELIVRTPWATQLACVSCATSFKRYDVEQIGEYLCDWPMGGEACGKTATHYFEGEGHQRPLCDEHARVCALGQKVHLIDGEGFNPKLVPYKPAPQPRVEQKADGTVTLRCHCGKPGRYRGGAEPMPLCDEHAPVAPAAMPQSPDVFTAADRYTPASAASVGDALKDLVLTAIQILKEKLQKWR